MKSRYTNLVVVLSAVLAFVPVLGVDYLLDSYVRSREAAELQRTVDQVTQGIAAGAHDAIGALRRILADSPSLCTSTFLSNLHKEMESSVYLRQVLVENPDGTQFCDAFSHPVHYSVLSRTLSIPGMAESLTLVQLSELVVPALKITQNFGSSRKVSVFVPVLTLPAEGRSALMQPSSMLRVMLSDGTNVVTIGDPAPFDTRKDPSAFISAQSFAGEMPLRSDAAVPFSAVRANYAELDIWLTFVSALMSAVVLLLGLQIARRTNLPAFDLETAISRGEIKPYYQPVINLSTGKLSGCEVLCRWEKPNGTVVSPSAFIEYAEMTGLAVPMTLSLMQQVREDLSLLCEEQPHLRVSINLFEGHFRDGTIVEDVRAIFEGSPISFGQLTFEITERQPLANSTQAHSVINGLHALGAKLAMDDVGTGHSNLAYMQTLGVDIIKIDRVFVDMIREDTVQVPVLDGLIAMARDLNVGVVAEGVETTTQALYLRARGVVLAQGFLFSPAIRPGAFRDLARALNFRPNPDRVEVDNAA